MLSDDRRQQLELRLRPRPARASSRAWRQLRAIASPSRSSPKVCSVNQTLSARKPRLRSTPYSREPRIAAGEPALGCGQIVGPQRERGAMQAARRGSGRSPRRRARAAICGSRTPALSARSIPASRGASSGTSTARPPNAASTWNQSRCSRHRARRSPPERIDRTGVDGAGATDDAEGLQARGAIGRDRCGQRGHVHGDVGVDRDQPQAVAAQAQELERLGDAAMRLARGVAHQRCSPPCSPSRRTSPPAWACRAAARPMTVAIEVPPTRRPLAPSGKPEELARPVDDLALDIDRAHARGRRDWG